MNYNVKHLIESFFDDIEDDITDNIIKYDDIKDAYALSAKHCNTDELKLQYIKDNLHIDEIITNIVNYINEHPDIDYFILNDDMTTMLKSYTKLYNNVKYDVLTTWSDAYPRLTFKTIDNNSLSIKVYVILHSLTRLTVHIDLFWGKLVDINACNIKSINYYIKKADKAILFAINHSDLYNQFFAGELDIL